MAALKLILMRHGEAEEGRGLPDHGRRLTARGSTDVRKVAAAMGQAGLVPTVALSSDSTRTKDTAVSANLEFSTGVTWQFRPELYLCGLEQVQAHLAKIDARKHQTVLLLGHNPGLSTTATVLSGDDVGLGTSHAAVLSVEAPDWREAAHLAGAWTLDRIIAP